MNRFAQEALFDRLAMNGRLDLALMPPLAGAIARFHLAAEQRTDHGGKAGMNWVVEGNADAFAEFGAGIVEPSACSRVTGGSRALLARHGELLDARREAGFVRQCHGDLHLRNIVLIDGHPTLFDGVEFNDEIACVDVLYDLAFLLMDLWHRQLPRHANAVWNGYLAETTDLNGVALMPLFLSCRAAIRAKTSASAAGVQQDAEHAGELRRMAGEYLALAEQLLNPPRASLIAIGGFSGSGKSTLALSLAPTVGGVPGAVVLRSDEIRKRLCGVAALEPLGPEAYAPDVSERVYTTLATHAGLLVRAGHSVIVDAVYASPAHRRAIEGVAGDASVPFMGLWLDAPESTLLERVERRRHDPSDADAGVVRMQRAQKTGVIGWHRLDGSASADDVLHAATTCLHDRADYVASRSR
jgi:predicted kinase